MLHEIGNIVLYEQVDLITTPSNKFHQMTHKVKYCKRGLATSMEMLNREIVLYIRLNISKSHGKLTLE
jgi:hypothetical protein